jgi:hypothetical protein
MENESTAKCDVFISYSRADQAVAAEIVQLLHARGLRPWFDKEQLIPGGLWQEVLEDTLGTVRCTAVLIGSGGVGPWQRPEMRVAIDESVRRGLPVIPVLLPGSPKQPALPLFLRGFTWVDLRGGLTKDGLDLLQSGITRRQVPGGGRKSIERAGPRAWLMIVSALVIAGVFGLLWFARGRVVIPPGPPPVKNSSYLLPGGAISWWRGERNAVDALGSNSGIIEAGVGFALGKVNEAFSFTGEDRGGGISLGNAPTLRFGPKVSSINKLDIRRTP